MATYQFGEEVFASKDKIADRVRGIVKITPTRAAIVGCDLVFILGLLSRHPQAARKIGAGVAKIVVEDNPFYASKGLRLYRIDGTETDFSWRECIWPTPHRMKVLSAMRVLIEPQTRRVKFEFFRNRPSAFCLVSGVVITPDNSHVDHISPDTFDALVAEFWKLKNINPDEVELSDELADNKYQDTLKDKTLAAEWLAFHAERAKLRVISASVNIALGAKVAQQKRVMYSASKGAK